MRSVWARIRQAREAYGGAAIAVVALAAVLVLLASCGAAQSRQSTVQTAQATSTPASTNTPAPTPTATHPPRPTATATPAPISGKIVRVVNSVPWLTGRVSVSCPAGSTLIGGGVDNGYGTSDYAGVLSSYPSSLNTWTVIGPMSNVSYTLSAVADCLQSATPIKARIIQLTSPTSTYLTGGGPVDVYDASCPSGVVTGGGYDVNGGGFVVDSHPDGANGWVSSAFRNGLTAYIICVSAHITERAIHETITYPLYSGNGPALVVQTALSCPSGYTLFSGGFGEPQSSEVQIGWGSNELVSSGQRWVVTGADKSGVPNKNKGYVYVLCALLA